VGDGDLQKALRHSRRGERLLPELLETRHGREYQSAELKRATAARKRGSSFQFPGFIAWLASSCQLAQPDRRGGDLEQFVRADVLQGAPRVIWIGDCSGVEHFSASERMLVTCLALQNI